MPDYTIKIDITSDDDEVLKAAVVGLERMARSMYESARYMAQSIESSDSYGSKFETKCKKLKNASTRLAEMSRNIDDLLEVLEQVKEDRPNVAKS